jgi:hypothetical protein
MHTHSRREILKAGMVIDGEVAITLEGFCTNKCAAFRTGCDNATSTTYLTQFSHVGKEFAGLTKNVFFSQNAFSIYTWRTEVGSEDKRNVRGMYSFLAQLPPQALAQIRQLTILLPPIDNASFMNGQLEWRPFWQASMQLLAAKASLPSLALTIKIGNYQSEHERLARKEHFTAQDGVWILQAYEDVVRPLAQWRALKQLFLYVSYPFGRASEAARAEVEQRLEQLVMGATYNAYSVGKLDPDEYTRPFLWDWYQ